MTAAFRKSRVDQERKAYDNFAHAVTVINEPHRMNHDGFVFHVSGKITGMIDDNVDDFLITTGANAPHIQRFKFDFGAGDVDIETYQDPTTSAAGAVLPGFNTNGFSSNTSTTVLTFGPTVSEVGTLVHTSWAPPTATGTGLSAAGIGNIDMGEEWIIAPNTKCLVRVTNNSGATIDYRYECLLYEIGYEYA